MIAMPEHKRKFNEERWKKKKKTRNALKHIGEADALFAA